MTTRRCLILSGHLGAGHDVVAEACADALRPYDVESKVLDSLALLGRRGSAIGDWVFDRLLAVPGVYDGFHFSQLRAGSRVARILDDLSLRNMWPRFRAEVDRFPPDLVISVFATGAAAAARLKRERPDVVTVVLCTDTWVHRMWVHDQTDLFLVTSEVAACSVRAYRPRARVEVVPAPARAPFYEAPSRATARASLGIGADERCVLLMSGSWGIGPLDEAAALLARAGLRVLAVAGHNDRLRERLEGVAAHDGRVVPFGFTDRIPELMAACDVVVTSSGDTCTEARAVGRGMVLLDVVPGHGRENLAHQLAQGNAAVCAPHPAAIVTAVEAFLDDASRCHAGPSPAISRASWEDPFRAALVRAGFPLDS